MKKPDVEYDDLRTACGQHCIEKGIQLVEVFYEKIIQLYEMTIVRHGLMVVRVPLL